MGLARARVAWPSLLNLTPADPLTLRRLGYLAERLSGYDEDGSASLRELAQRLSESLTLDAAAPEAPLASETPRARELRLTRDEVHTRWKILSEPDVWAAYCT